MNNLDKIVITNHNVTEYRIYPFIRDLGIRFTPFAVANAINYKINALHRNKWQRVKAKRTERLYTAEFEQEKKDSDGNLVLDSDGNPIIELVTKTVVRDYYDYVYRNGGTKIKSWSRKVQWLDINGNVALEKEIDTETDRLSIHSLNVGIWKDRILYLVAAGEGFEDDAKDTSLNLTEQQRQQLLFFATKIDELLEHYNPQIIKYERTGSIELYNSIVNESEQSIKDLLNLVDKTNPLEWTMGKTMLYQFSPEGTDPATLKDRW